MPETYCGKTCEACTYKKSLDCPGCKAGPGKLWSCECGLAKCCKEKGHETCDACCYNDTCATLRAREVIPQNRLKQQTVEADRKAEKAQRVLLLGKWLWILFWLVIPGMLAGIMTTESIVKLLPAIDLPGQILNVFCSAAYGLILLKLKSAHDYYRISGICYLVGAAVSTAIACTSGGSVVPTWGWILILPVGIISLAGEYHEYIGHAGVLGDVDNELSVNWKNLWKWYIRMIAGILGSFIIMLVAPTLGFLMLLGAGIGFIGASIMKLVYLYKTAKLFRAYALKYKSDG